MNGFVGCQSPCNVTTKGPDGGGTIRNRTGILSPRTLFVMPSSQHPYLPSDWIHQGMSLIKHAGERPKHSFVCAKWLDVYCIRSAWGMKYASAQYGIYWVSSSSSTWYLCNPAVLAPSFSYLALALATSHLPNGGTAWETPSLRICENPLILMEKPSLWSFR